jgi:hypothetical protein
LQKRGINLLKWLHRLNYKYGRHYITNLILYIIIAQAAVYVFDYLFATKDLVISDYLYFDRNLILAGQVWRAVTFVFVPPMVNPIFMLFFMQLYYMIGRSLELSWGGFYFNAYYFMGVILSMAGGFISGYADITYLNLSMFLAFAILFPNERLLILFFIPVKIKYIAIVDIIGLAFIFIISGWSGKLAILMSLLNLVLFFWDDFYPKIRDKWRYRKIRSQWKR